MFVIDGFRPFEPSWVGRLIKGYFGVPLPAASLAVVFSGRHPLAAVLR